MKCDNTKEIPDDPIATDNFSSWLHHTRNALSTGRDCNVPCGECTACCISSYFIHINPDESRTIAAIPGKLLFPAPGLPAGHFVLGYDEKGRCPMFVGGRCSIYERRPRTCRSYDCRVLAAAGLQETGDKISITRQALRWEFAFSGKRDRDNIFAVKVAAKFIVDHAKDFPAGFVPANAPQQAVLAIKIYEVFLNSADVYGKNKYAERKHEVIKSIISAFERFEAAVAV